MDGWIHVASVVGGRVGPVLSGQKGNDTTSMSTTLNIGLTYVGQKELYTDAYSSGMLHQSIECWTLLKLMHSSYLERLLEPHVTHYRFRLNLSRGEENQPPHKKKRNLQRKRNQRQTLLTICPS
jgi:hypothetical protein